MASLQNGALLLSVIYLLTPVLAMDNLQVAFEWKQLDFAYSYQGAREEAIKNGEFIPENNIPVGLEVFEDRLFVTIPRWKKGVPASLAYVSLTNRSNTSPELIPYPNWEAHRVPVSTPAVVAEASNSTEVPPAGEHVEAPVTAAPVVTPELVSPFRVRADRCGRLWVLDSGFSDILEDNATITPPHIVVYDLRTDKLIKRYTIPEDQVLEKSMFANIAVEDTSCEDSFAYAADLKNPGLVVYSLKNDSSWRIQHHFFHPDPLAGDFNVTGINFQWDDALFGIGLSGPGADGFSTLYFHPLASTNEFSVSTKVLRNKTLADESFNEFKLLGNRGPNAQSGVEFVDKTTGVLFYSLVNLNAVACWKTSNKAYTIESQGRIFMSNTTMVFPNDVKVDDKGNLWVLSDRLSTFMYSKLNPEDVNFRILTESVTDAIRGTACDTNLSIDTLHKLNNIVNASDRVKERVLITAGATSDASTINYIVLAQVLAFFVAFQLH